jgi:hypothetical protein
MATNGATGNNYMGLQTNGSTPTSASEDTRMRASGGSGNLPLPRANSGADQVGCPLLSAFPAACLYLSAVLPLCCCTRNKPLTFPLSHHGPSFGVSFKIAAP